MNQMPQGDKSSAAKNLNNVPQTGYKGRVRYYRYRKANLCLKVWNIAPSEMSNQKIFCKYIFRNRILITGTKFNEARQQDTSVKSWAIRIFIQERKIKTVGRQKNLLLTAEYSNKLANTLSVTLKR